MRIECFDTVVVGSGAAGYNAAIRIKEDATKTVCIVTEGVLFGTSRNTGSDKQTYYKLGLGGDSPDSVAAMAENLFSCGSVDGDNALCEAALSSRCFFRLCELGVPFPVNRYGEYVGYKTDHDPFARATSAGPLTSKFMTEALEKKADVLNIEVFDGYLAVEVLTDRNGVCGLLTVEKKSGEYVTFCCANVVLCTGGPAGIYADSVYPASQCGATSLALFAGASLQNMTEWQYGLASIAPRWNVSGTYMQVLPRFVSIDEDGNESEFLLDYFKDPYAALSVVFLKGYQWPFDSKKVLDGSSVIDLLVYRECVMKKRRVYLDFTKNPFGLENIAFEKLSDEAYNYLKKADALFGTPLDRLDKMNRPAIEIYASKGLDITKEYLEIALCAQHNNGGIAVDLWWQTSVVGLFAAGECAGTHGITRPGGSALNAGQVGSLRAAQYICQSKRRVDKGETSAALEKVLGSHLKLHKSVLKNEDNVSSKIKEAARLMSDCGGAIRELDAMLTAYDKTVAALADVVNEIGVDNAGEIYKVYQLVSILTTQAATLAAMIDFAQKRKQTRGSALYPDNNGALRDGLDELFRFTPEKVFSGDKIQQVKMENGNFAIDWRDVRPIPQKDDFFETVWRGYRENKNIF